MLEAYVDRRDGVERERDRERGDIHCCIADVCFCFSSTRRHGVCVARKPVPPLSVAPLPLGMYPVFRFPSKQLLRPMIIPPQWRGRVCHQQLLFLALGGSGRPVADRRASNDDARVKLSRSVKVDHQGFRKHPARQAHSSSECLVLSLLSSENVVLFLPPQPDLAMSPTYYLHLSVFAPFFFQDKPVMVEEGLMTLLRKNVVSNARLLKCADGRGLRVRTPPPFRRVLSAAVSPVPSSRVS